MSLLIGDKMVVTMHYKLTNNEGQVLDSSEGGDPLTYLHGARNIIPGLENELTGKTSGAKLTVKVPAAEGYGEVNPQLVQAVPRSMFQDVDKIEVGMMFQAQGPDGSSQQIVVKKVEDDEITVDGNHPLAGVELNFDVEVVNVREATEEEITHGHAH